MGASKPLALLGVLALCVVTAADRAVIADPDALRRIVQEQCVPDWHKEHNPSPCVRLQISNTLNINNGFAVLHDRKGGAHYLLIPTDTIPGIESPTLLEPGTANFFAAAWQARDLLEDSLGHPVPRGAIGLAINRQAARSQNQLHIHIECLRRQVYEALQAHAEAFGDHWSPVDVAGATYLALRVMGTELGQANPFTLLADHLPDARANMAAYTLVVAGMDFQAGPGFIVLTGRSVPSGELLLDATCAVASSLGEPPASAADHDR